MLTERSRTIKLALTLALSCLLLVFATSDSALPFQFEDYQWGQPLAEAMKKLTTDKKKFVSSDYGLTYNDNILEKPCEVFLVFTPQTHLLSFISIVWTDTSAAEQLKKEFTKKYGQAYLALPDIYIWVGADKDISNCLYLNFAAGTSRLLYFGGEYYEKYTQEITEQVNNNKEKK